MFEREGSPMLIIEIKSGTVENLRTGSKSTVASCMVLAAPGALKRQSETVRAGVSSSLSTGAPFFKTNMPPGSLLDDNCCPKQAHSDITHTFFSFLNNDNKPIPTQNCLSFHR